MAMVEEQLQEFPCYNFKKKIEKACEFAGNTLVSSSAVLKIIKSAAALKILKTGYKVTKALKEETLSKIDKFSRRAKKIPPSNLPSREFRDNKMGLSPSQLSYSPLTTLGARSRSQMEKKLMSGKIKNVKKMGGGINSTFIVTFEDGTKGVWKPHAEIWGSNYRAEVLAYEISNKFGFGLVPPTVERVYKGKVGSVQLFRDDGKVPLFRDDDEAPLIPKSRNRKLTSEFQKQSLFDYLIDNRDRHSDNYLVDKKGKVISIDNGLSFTGKGNHPQSFESREHDIREFLQTPAGRNIFKRLKNTRLDTLEEEANKYLGKEDAKNLIQRIQHVIKTYDGK
ncbi:MAG: hypothetical protein ACXWRE_09865 [Pseudobdellovibrionaceae bacterium]